MYFYTDLKVPFDRKGLVGVNIHTGRDARFILASDPDQQFVTDDSVNLLYSADGGKLQAFDVLSRRSCLYFRVSERVISENLTYHPFAFPKKLT